MKQQYEKAGALIQSLDLKIEWESVSISVDTVQTENFPEGFFDWHAHPIFELHYIKKGRGTVEMENREWQLKPGSFYLTGPGVLHRQTVDPVMLEYAFRFSLSCPKIASGVISEIDAVANVIHNTRPVVVQDISQTDRVFEGIFEEILSQKPGYFTRIKTGIINILICTARNLSGNRFPEYYVPRRRMNRYRMEEIRKYIETNCSRPIRCSELARFAFLSEKQLCRVIKNETSMSTHAFIQHCRIQKAKKLLQSHDRTLRSIAAECGFSSEFHLSSAFRKVTGFSPSQYRKSLY